MDGGYVIFNDEDSRLDRAKRSVGVLLGSLELEDNEENWIWGLEKYRDALLEFKEEGQDVIMWLVDVNNEIHRLRSKV